MKKADSREEVTGYEFDSSVIKKAQYNYSTNALTIEFTKGESYQYDGVEVRVFNEFVEANSQGIYFAQNIKENYSWNKI